MMFARRVATVALAAVAGGIMVRSFSVWIGTFAANWVSSIRFVTAEPTRRSTPTVGGVAGVSPGEVPPSVALLARVGMWNEVWLPCWKPGLDGSRAKRGPAAEAGTASKAVAMAVATVATRGRPRRGNVLFTAITP